MLPYLPVHIPLLLEEGRLKIVRLQIRCSVQLPPRVEDERDTKRLEVRQHPQEGTVVLVVEVRDIMQLALEVLQPADKEIMEVQARVVAALAA